MYHGMMGNATVRGGEEGSSPVSAPTITVGSIEGFTTDQISPWWATTTGGTDTLSTATSASMSVFSSAVSITLVDVPDAGYPGVSSIRYAKAGPAFTYSAAVTFQTTDVIKIGIVPNANQANAGSGRIEIYANGTYAGFVFYQYDPA